MKSSPKLHLFFVEPSDTTEPGKLTAGRFLEPWHAEPGDPNAAGCPVVFCVASDVVIPEVNKLV